MKNVNKIINKVVRYSCGVVDGMSLVRYIIILLMIIVTCGAYEPIRLTLEEDQYVNIMTGNPGRFNKYRIDYKYNNTYIYLAPSSYSQTYTQYDELYYFYDKKIRLDTTYGVPENNEIIRITPVTHNGILGLGDSSNIWKYWNRATLSSEKLILGEFDPYIAQHDTYSFIIKKGESIRCKVNDKLYKLEFDQTNDVTYLPTELYTLKSFDIYFKYDKEECFEACDKMGIDTEMICDYKKEESKIHVSMFDYTIVTTTGVIYPLVMTNKADKDKIVLGRKYMDNMVVFVDKTKDITIIKPDFRRFEYFNSKDANSYLAFITCLIYIIWSLSINSELADVERNRIFFALLQLYGHVVIFVSLSYNFVGIECYRFYRHYLHINSSIPLYLILITALSLLVLSVWLLCKLFYFSRKPFESPCVTDDNHPIMVRWTAVELLRRNVFETLLLLSLWIITLEYHNNSCGGHLILISTVIAITQLVTFMMMYIRSSILYLFHFLLFVLSIVFLVGFNLIPLLEGYLYYHPYYYPLILMYISLLVLLPSLFIIVQVERARMSYRIEKIKCA